MSGISKGKMPILRRVEAVGPRSLRVVWRKGRRSGREDVIDLSPLIDVFKVFKPLRANPDLLRKARVVAYGNAIGFGEDDRLQMSATSLERLAFETMTPDDLRTWFTANNFTHAGGAAAIGYKKRQIEAYLSGERPIPRSVALACFGYQALSSDATLDKVLEGA